MRVTEPFRGNWARARASRPLAHRKHLPLDINWDVLESRALGNSKLLGYILNKLDSETNGIYRI